MTTITVNKLYREGYGGDLHAVKTTFIAFNAHGDEVGRKEMHGKIGMPTRAGSYVSKQPWTGVADVVARHQPDEIVAFSWA